MTGTAESDQTRNCYCNLWESNPAVLEKLGIPRGYCGICDVKNCGKPGHLRSDPIAPCSTAYCDEHWEAMLKKLPLRRVVQFMISMLFYAGVIGGIWWCIS